MGCGPYTWNRGHFFFNMRRPIRGPNSIILQWPQQFQQKSSGTVCKSSDTKQHAGIWLISGGLQALVTLVLPTSNLSRVLGNPTWPWIARKEKTSTKLFGEEVCVLIAYRNGLCALSDSSFSAISDPILLALNPQSLRWRTTCHQLLFPQDLRTARLLEQYFAATTPTLLTF